VLFRSIGSKLVAYSKTLFTSLTGVLTPTFSAMDARGDMEGIRRMTITGSRYVLWAVLPLQVGLFILGKPFLTLWMGPRYAEASHLTLVILAMPLALSQTLAMGVRVLYGTGRLEWYCRAIIAEAASNLILSTALARPLGIEGVAWGTTLPNLVFNAALLVYTCRFLGIGPWDYVRDVLLRPTLLGCLLACGWMITTFLVPPRTVPTFIATGFFGLIVYAAVAVLVEFGPRWVLQVINSRIRALT
jgi:O-antigen/teichoic acid export membrane protein